MEKSSRTSESDRLNTNASNRLAGIVKFLCKTIESKLNALFERLYGVREDTNESQETPNRLFSSLFSNEDIDKLLYDNKERIFTIEAEIKALEAAIAKSQRLIEEYAQR